MRDLPHILSHFRNELNKLLNNKKAPMLDSIHWTLKLLKIASLKC